MAFWPGLIVLSGVTALGAVSIFYSAAELLENGVSPIAVKLGTVLILITWGMSVWSWIYTASCDPGRIKDDLEARGLLQTVLRGDIPPCLRALPICRHCMLPKPRGSEHCETCEHCVLRYDHHCGVIGACIADKNVKAFVLTFLYMSAFGILCAVMGFYAFSLENKKSGSIIGLIVGIYAIAVALSLLVFAIATIYEGLSTGEIDKINGRKRSLKIRRYLETFGDVWWERLIPIQRHTTFLAWPGVSWDDDLQIP